MFGKQGATLVHHDFLVPLLAYTLGPGLNCLIQPMALPSIELRQHHLRCSSVYSFLAACKAAVVMQRIYQERLQVQAMISGSHMCDKFSIYD